MTKATIIQKLSAHAITGTAPREELAWIAERGHLRNVSPGEVLSSASERIDHLFLVLAGHFTIHVDRGAGRHKVLEWRAGSVTGLLPYSRLDSPPGDVVAEEPSEVLAIHRQDLPDMIRSCHEVTSKLVHVMLDRARTFTSSDLHDEKMISLGKLAAGLAHELNNPASALVRCAKLIPAQLATSDAASRALGACELDEEQAVAIDGIREACETDPRSRSLSPLAKADRENAIADWLAAHGVDTTLAESLAESGATSETLEEIGRRLEPSAVEPAMRWLAAGCAARQLASELEDGAVRIFELVSAVRGFTHMDQAPVAQAVDIRQGLMQTVTMLGPKARARSLTVDVTVDEDLPAVHAHAGELNQVWSNLIDNAVDAAESRVEIGASHARGRMHVRVVDDGPGIAPDLLDRIFDPFVTTKPVGQGTGLGLDIARRLVRRYDGDIEIDSAPGRTEFRVSLPLADAEAGRGRS